MSLIEALPSWIRDTPIGRQIVEMKRQAVHTERQAIVDRRDARLAELPRLLKKHDQTIEPLATAAAAAKAKYDAAAGKLLAAQRSRGAALHTLQRDIEADEGLLARTADPRVRDAKAALGARYEHERHAIGRSQEIETGGRDPETMKRLTRIVSNQRAIERLLAAIRDARAAFDRLLFENPENVEVAIAAIMAPVDQAFEAVHELDPVPPRAA